MVQLASQSTFFSSSPRMRSSSGATRAIKVCPREIENGLYATVSLYRTSGQLSLRRICIMRRMTGWLATILIGVLAQPAWAAAPCRNDVGFERWLEDFKRDAVAQGVSRQVADSALAGVTFDPSI